jgi:hypothetical protein
MQTRARLFTLWLATSVATLGASAARADLYRWIDANGVARFTTDPGRVPSAQRATLARVETDMPAAPARAPAAAAATPPAIFAPPGDPALDGDPFNEPDRAREAESTAIEPLAPVESAPAQAATTPAARTEAAAAAVPRAAPAAPTAPAARRAPVASSPRGEADATVAARATDAWGEVVVVDGEPRAPQPSEAPAEAAAPLPAATATAAEAATPAVSAPPPPPAELRVEETTPALVAAAEHPSEGPHGAAAEAPASAPEAAPAAPAPADTHAARQEELRAAIARDEETLKALISANPDAPLAPTPELREIAERLPKLQAELRALEAQSEAP